jgi:hypothetical protein
VLAPGAGALGSGPLAPTQEEAVLVAYTFGQAMWTMFVFFMWILWFWLLFTVFGDLFRRHDLGG